MLESDFLTYPMRPINGGRLELAREKPGNWVVEPKPNGYRQLINLKRSLMWSRYGTYLATAGEYKIALEKLKDALPDVEWVDGEGLLRRHNVGQGSIVVIDILDNTTAPLEMRREPAVNIPLLPISDALERDSIYLMPRFPWSMSSALYAEAEGAVKACKKPIFEGIVAKSMDNPQYPIQRVSPNRESPWWVKHRFLR